MIAESDFKTLAEEATLKSGIIRRELHRQILGGQFVPGDALPSEHALCARFGVAWNTVRKALEELGKEGIIYRLQGKGTFVAPAKPDPKGKVKLNIFCLVVPEVNRDLFPQIINGFDEAAMGIHHQMMVCTTRNDVDRQGNIMLQALDKNMAGVALVPMIGKVTPPHHLRQLQASDIPVVLCNRPVAGDAGVADWVDGSGYGSTFHAYSTAPYFVYGATGTAGAGDDVYFVDMTSNALSVNTAVTINSLTMGDNYWPAGYASYGYLGPNQRLNVTAGADLQMNRFNFGGTSKPFTSNDLRGGSSIAPNGKIFVTGGTASLGDIHVLSSDTTVTTAGNLGVSYSEIANGAAGVNNNSMTVNMNNIYLNEHYLFLHINAGTWNITGDVLLEGEATVGNMVMLLTGNNEIYSAEPTDGRMNIKETVLDQIIAAGQLWTRYGLSNTNMIPAYQRTSNGNINLLDPTDNGTFVPTIPSRQNFVQITDANKDYYLRIVDIDGDAGDMVRVHIVPEPATLVLLGLGAVLSFRRKR